jgi:hypothetical protein
MLRSDGWFGRRFLCWRSMVSGGRLGRDFRSMAGGAHLGGMLRRLGFWTWWWRDRFSLGLVLFDLADQLIGFFLGHLTARTMN